ncbi:MAG: hypothetical protein HKN17_00185 [Rhodothermales bacterium]|nr:hypothetical protein [Rhodothermales bacterium]
MSRSPLVAGALLLMLLAPFAAGAAFAQSQSDGSIYSRFGLGERHQFFSPQSQAMGGGGIALRSFRYVNASNPSSWYDQRFVRAAGSATFQRITESADGADTSTLGSGQLTAVQVGFPIYTRKTGLAFSFAPYTRMNYRVESRRELETGDGDPVPYTLNFGGNGGIQRLSGGFGQKVGSRLSLGASFDYLFGILEQTRSSEFQNINYTDRTIVSGTRLRGVTGSLGASFTALQSGGTQDALVVSAVVTLPTTLSGERIETLGTGETADTLSAGPDGDVRIPMTLKAGVAWTPDPRWLIVADAVVEPWSSFESDFSLSGYDPATGGALSDRTRLSAGVEYWPGAQRLFSGFFTRMAYRFGVYSDVDYISPDPSHEIRSFGLTGGLSVPSRIPGTTLDLNIDVGRRGTTEDGLIRDRYIRFGLNLNFGERWFDRLPLG